MPLSLRPLLYLSSLTTMLMAACSSPPEPPPLTPTSQTWTQQQLETIGTLYGITPGGMEALQGLDIRQMVGQPGYFGSFGFFDWTGVGEAKPIQVVHEISHAYWGAFPIDGSPDLSWRTPQGGAISPAMERYHQDVLTFMAQPPDEYEPLRRRLMLLPGLAQDNTGPLFHTVEADLVYTVAGDLDLVLETMAFFAYDAHRPSQVPSLPISLEADGRFLSELVGLMGGPWLMQQMSETIDVTETVWLGVMHPLTSWRLTARPCRPGLTPWVTVD